jgi:hypothetical protein
MQALEWVDRERAFQIWREFATGSDALYAVQLLCYKGGSKGRRVLEDLYKSRAVVDPKAAHWLVNAVGKGLFDVCADISDI